jgi:Fe-S-cluster-containing dehydrogenase component
MEICPADAIQRDEKTGAISIDPSRCAGCKMCMLACPAGNIHFNSTEHISEKCDLCEGDPHCVKFCTSGALNFEEEEDAYTAGRESVDAQIIRMLSVERKEDG